MVMCLVVYISLPILETCCVTPNNSIDEEGVVAEALIKLSFVALMFQMQVFLWPRMKEGIDLHCNIAG